jgi:cell division protein YceG involved in septum cleavage
MKKIAKKIWKFWALGIGTSLIVSLLLVGLVWWALQPAAITQTATQTFIVPKGQSIKLIGQRLETAEIIRHSWAFVLMVKWLETTSQVQAGSFQLSPSWSVARIV